MAILKPFLQPIADAIRSKTGSSQPIPANEYADKINDITILDSAETIKGIIEGTVEGPLVIEGLTTLRPYAFYNCNKLKGVTLPNGITKIPEKCFYGCSKLDIVEIPESVTNVESGAFTFAEINKLYVNPTITKFSSSSKPNTQELYLNCTFDQYRVLNLINNDVARGNKIYLKNSDGAYYHVTEIVIPEGQTSIGGRCFMGWTINKLKLPQSLITINKEAFKSHQCSEIIIPANVKTLAQECFSNIMNTTYIFEGNVPPTLGTSALSKNYINKIFVPTGCRETYIQSSTNWSALANYIVENNDITINVPAELLNNEAYTYSTDGGDTYNMFTTLATNFEGINIIKIKNTSNNKLSIFRNDGSEIGSITAAEISYITTADEILSISIT